MTRPRPKPTPAPPPVEPRGDHPERYRGYLIRCDGESFTITYAGGEIVSQPYPGARARLGDAALIPWMIEQAKSYVDARRAGCV